MIKQLTYQEIKAAVEKAGHKFHTEPFKMNLVGIRSNNRTIGGWDDVFILAYVDEQGGETIVRNDSFTTDPGTYYMQKQLLNPEGCAILAPGQYIGMWRHGLHFGYPAFVQRGNCKVYRDRNKDNVLDFLPGSVDIGVFGINGHHGFNQPEIGKNSAGCQVFRHVKDLQFILLATDKHAARYGNSFDYTLLNEADL